MINADLDDHATFVMSPGDCRFTSRGKHTEMYPLHVPQSASAALCGLGDGLLRLDRGQNL